MHARRLAAPFGAVLELDAVGSGAGLGELLAEHGLLVVRGREISREQQIELVGSSVASSPTRMANP